MREIKFRGKDLKSGMWAYGDLHTLCDQPHIHTEVSSYPFAGKRSFVNPDTIGQYTGLNDKNDDEIYEGDIIRFTKGKKKVDGEWKEDNEIRVVRYEDAAFSGILSLVHTLESVEIIGNIYDNPELLEKTTSGQ